MLGRRINTTAIRVKPANLRIRPAHRQDKQAHRADQVEAGSPCEEEGQPKHVKRAGALIAKEQTGRLQPSDVSRAFTGKKRKCGGFAASGGCECVHRFLSRINVSGGGIRTTSRRDARTSRKYQDRPHWLL